MTTPSRTRVTRPRTSEADELPTASLPVDTAPVLDATFEVAGGWKRFTIGRRSVEVYIVGDGAPVLFLHGWGLSPRSYRRAIDALAEQGYRVYAPSLPGFGRSDALGVRRQNVLGVAAHITDLLDRLPFNEPVHVVGHSFGGGVAMRVAAIHPDRVRSLTLVCPVGGAGNGAVPLTTMAVGALHESRNRWVGLAASEFATALARHPGSVLATAYAAWRSDQLVDLQQIGAHQIPTRFLFADHDTVVSAGSIPDTMFDRVTCEIVAGHHSWLISDPAGFALHASGHLASA